MEVATTDKDLIDALEKRILEWEPDRSELIHVFTPYLYTRSIFMPAGSLIVSKIHKTQHPYVVSAGKALVRISEGDWELIEASHIGITQPGTRRVLYILEDCIWTTSHVSNVMPEDGSDDAVQRAVDEIEEQIIEKNPAMISHKIKMHGPPQQMILGGNRLY